MEEGNVPNQEAPSVNHPSAQPTQGELSNTKVSLVLQPHEPKPNHNETNQEIPTPMEEEDMEDIEFWNMDLQQIIEEWKNKDPTITPEEKIQMVAKSCHHHQDFLLQ